jgi:hypothetical protein
LHLVGYFFYMICPQFLTEYNFDSLGLLPHIWSLLPFQRKYCQSLYCDFVLHSDLETWPRYFPERKLNVDTGRRHCCNLVLCVTESDVRWSAYSVQIHHRAEPQSFTLNVVSITVTSEVRTHAKFWNPSISLDIVTYEQALAFKCMAIQQGYIFL